MTTTTHKHECSPLDVHLAHYSCEQCGWRRPIDQSEADVYDAIAATPEDKLATCHFCGHDRSEDYHPAGLYLKACDCGYCA